MRDLEQVHCSRREAEEEQQEEGASLRAALADQKLSSRHQTLQPALREAEQGQGGCQVPVSSLTGPDSSSLASPSCPLPAPFALTPFSQLSCAWSGTCSSSKREGGGGVQPSEEKD